MSESLSMKEEVFLKIAENASSLSKDPSTKVGAVITDRDSRFISLGYNGMSKGLVDDDFKWKDRDTKNALVIHAEVNAILFAKQDLTDCVMYTTLFPCSRCASIIIQAGISKVVCNNPLSSSDYSHGLTEKIFNEAGIECVMRV